MHTLDTFRRCFLILIATLAVGAALPAAAQELDVEALMADRVLGDPDAPVTMIEYSSLTCPHCAAFHTNVLPTLKEKYIDTGKVKLIFRDFPFDEVGMRAHMLVRCTPADRSYAMLDVLFAQQMQWARAEDPMAALRQLALLSGMGPDQFETCMDSSALVDGILARRLEGEEEYNIRSTPSFILDDGAERVVGNQPLARFEAAIEKRL